MSAPPAGAAPAFAEGAEIGDLVFTAGEEIEALRLPRASGGDVDAALNDGELSDYSFDPSELPEGLVFDRLTRELSGAPAATLEKTAYAYWVHDDDEDYSAGDGDSIAFSITVEAGEVPEPTSRLKDSSVRQALAGFGRTVASDAVDLVQSRVRRSSSRPTRNQTGLGSHPFGAVPISATDPRHQAGRSNSGNLAGRGLIRARDHAEYTDASPTSVAWSGTNHYGQPWNRGSATPVTRGTSFIDLLSRTSFEYRLEGGEDGEDADPDSGWTLWARGSRSEFQNDADHQFSVRGSVQSAHLGADYWFGKQGMLGGALSKSTGTVDYRVEDAREGELDISLVTGFQYGAWAPSDDTSFWGVFGIGGGEMDLHYVQVEQGSADVAFQMGALGAHKNIASLGEVNWAAKADAVLSRLASDNIPDPQSDAGRPLLPSIQASAWRLRAMMEASRLFQLSEHAFATPSFEFGLLREGGDFREDYLGEVGADLTLQHSGLGLGFEAAIRALASGEERDFNDWSASLTLNIDPGVDGTGMALSLTPVWGASSSGAGTSWQQPEGLRHILRRHPAGKDRLPHREERVDLRISSGFGLHRGLFTPFGQFSTAQGDLRRIRIGAQLRLDLRGARGLPGGLQVEFAYEAADDQGIFLTLRHQLH